MVKSITWEKLSNPQFKGIEFETLINQAGRNRFAISPSSWIKKTNAISLMYFPNSIDYLKNLFGEAITIRFDQEEFPPYIYERKPEIKEILEIEAPKHIDALYQLEKWIILKRYSHATLKNYKSAFRKFLLYYNDIAPKDIGIVQIKDYIMYLNFILV